MTMESVIVNIKNHFKQIELVCVKNKITGITQIDKKKEWKEFEHELYFLLEQNLQHDIIEAELQRLENTHEHNIKELTKWINYLDKSSYSKNNAETKSLISQIEINAEIDITNFQVLNNHKTTVTRDFLTAFHSLLHWRYSYFGKAIRTIKKLNSKSEVSNKRVKKTNISTPEITFSDMIPGKNTDAKKYNKAIKYIETYSDTTPQGLAALVVALDIALNNKAELLRVVNNHFGTGMSRQSFIDFNLKEYQRAKDQKNKDDERYLKIKAIKDAVS
jgi:hypothetical protein